MSLRNRLKAIFEKNNCNLDTIEERRLQEQLNEKRGRVWMEQTLQDFRHAVRTLCHHRGFTFVAIATLALGLGVNTALFSVFNALVLRPLPLKDVEDLVDVVGQNDIGWQVTRFSYSDYLDLRAGQRSVPALAAWLEMVVTMNSTEVNAPSFQAREQASGGPVRLSLQLVSQNFFDVLGADLAIGRGFRPDENLYPGTNPVIVLQHQFWRQQFHSDPNVLGQTIKLRDTVFTVIGVAAPEFVGKMPAPPIGWVPAMMYDTLMSDASQRPNGRNNTRVELVARVPEGPARDQARAELEVLILQLAQKYPSDHPITRIKFKNTGSLIAVPLNFRTLVWSSPIWLSFALVLFIACANVANLLLARASTRQQEIGVRLALGASRGRILRHLLMESMLVALIGGLVGLLIGTWTLHAIRPAIIALIPVANGAVRDWLFVNLSPDYRVFGFTLLTAFMAALAAGLYPALLASRMDVNGALKMGGSLFSQRSRLRHSLVVLQVAMCLMLLMASGLLVRLVLRYATIESGLHTENVYGVGLSRLPSEIAKGSNTSKSYAMEGASQTPAAQLEVLALARTLPGIKAVSRASRVPYGGPMRVTPVVVDDHEFTATPMFAKFNLVSAEYFAMLGLVAMKGRTFVASEVERKVPVVVISEATARRYWPGENPLGKRLKISSVAFAGGWNGPRSAQQESAGVFSLYDVIGVVPDARSGWIWEPDETMLYLPLPDDSPVARTLLQFTGPRETAMPLALGAASAQGVNLGLNFFMALDESRNFQLLPYKGAAAVGAGLGILALLMAVVGLYGVMTFVVSRRVSEIGIRTALGATPQNIVEMFVRQGMRLVSIGLALGGIGGLLVAVVLSKIVVGTQPYDLLVYGAVVLLLAVAALFACWLPARRAAKVDPVVALRAE